MGKSWGPSSILILQPGLLSKADISSIAKQVVGERFGQNKKTQRDMLGSFINHGLTQEEAESESLVQMLVSS